MSSQDAGHNLAAPRRLLLRALTVSEDARLRLGGPRTWQPENPGGPFLTTVLRLPQPLADRVHRDLRPLRRAANCHYHYPATSLHVTLLNLDWMCAPGEPLEVLAYRVAPLLAPALAGARGIVFEVGGLRLARHAVFANACGVHAPGTLARLRRRLAHALMPIASAKRRARLVDDQAFLNVVRYGAHDLAALRQATLPMRHHEFGTFSPETVELVSTDKVLSSCGTRVFAEVPFGDNRPLSGGMT